ncbi:hypothetical protein [Lactococcus termiticola]|uniref:Uncharacterized protein n=1 Tax=Lactococcus termiticola TaxID=2169526 RepID=A0A2R5HJR2_9LACT|nr:hypothetical protein [Lactococcus termiticola]GBG96898.1 hypothetical protein NtB2_01033 [Lactococcus termiticola]
MMNLTNTQTTYNIGQLIIKTNRPITGTSAIQFPLTKEKGHEMLEEMFQSEEMKKARLFG